MKRESKSRRHFLVTGFPELLAARLVQHLVRAHRGATFSLLVEPKRQPQAEQLLAAMARTGRTSSLKLLQGSATKMHLGLSGKEYLSLARSATDIIHAAYLGRSNAPREEARRVNVGGTQNVIELARDCHDLRRLWHFSTAFVSGDRQGVVSDDEAQLDHGQRFHHAAEQTRFEAERLVRSTMSDLPAIIFRPSTIVGDSRTGEIDRFDGLCYETILQLANPRSLPLAHLGAAAPLHLVPIDFVVEAASAIAENPEAPGLTFHLVDPQPISGRALFELTAQLTNRALPKQSATVRAAEALLRFPLFGDLSSRATQSTRRASLRTGSGTELVFYRCLNTLRFLTPHALSCPPIESYLIRLVEYVRERLRHHPQRPRLPSVDDPLDFQLSDVERAARALP